MSTVAATSRSSSSGCPGTWARILAANGRRCRAGSDDSLFASWGKALGRSEPHGGRPPGTPSPWIQLIEGDYPVAWTDTAYARFGADSDVYVYSTGRELTCLTCILGPGFSFDTKTTAAMFAHLEGHRAAGHNVPDDAIADLLARQQQNDAGFSSASGVPPTIYPPASPAEPGWVLVGTIETTSRCASEAKADFLAAHPELQDLEPKSIRIDVICGRNPTSSWLRFSIRKDAIQPG